IFALARIFNRPVGDFFMPPEPHFHGHRVMMNGIPGDPEVRVTAPALTREQAVDLAVRIVGPEPASAAERKRPNALTNQLVELVSRTVLQPAIQRALEKHLEHHPEALKELLTQGIPQSVVETPEAAGADLIPAQEDELFREIVGVVEKSKAAASKR